MVKKLTHRRYDGEVCPSISQSYTRRDFENWLIEATNKLALYEELDPSPASLKAKLAALEVYKRKEIEVINV